jgi:hypothetical protein
MELALRQIEGLLLEAETHRMRRRVIALENQILQLPKEIQVLSDDLFLKHHFSPGIYMRELHIPAGIVSTGAIHKYACQNILLKGERATIVDNKIVRIRAPHIHVSPAGSKRASYTFTDSIWITIHPNPSDSQDIDALVADIACDTEEEYQSFLAERARQQ